MYPLVSDDVLPVSAVCVPLGSVVWAGCSAVAGACCWTASIFTYWEKTKPSFPLITT